MAMTPKQIQQACEMREAGATWTLIAERFGVSKQWARAVVMKRNKANDGRFWDNWARSYWAERGIDYDTGKPINGQR